MLYLMNIRDLVNFFKRSLNQALPVPKCKKDLVKIYAKHLEGKAILELRKSSPNTYTPLVSVFDHIDVMLNEYKTYDY